MISLLILAVGLALQSPSPAQNVDLSELTRLEALWNEAHLRGDASALDRLWADDLVAIVPRMTPLTKQEALAFVRSARMSFTRYGSADVAVKVYGDSAVARGRLRRSRDIGGRTVQDDWRFTKLYVRRGGQWRVVAFHASEAGS